MSRKPLVPGPTEILATNAHAHPRTVHGCQKFQKDVMISVGAPTDEAPMRVLDVFLSTADAKALHEELGRVLQLNDKQP